MKVLLLVAALAAAAPGGFAIERHAEPQAVPKLWYEAYLDGVAAFRADQWQRAVTLLEASLKLNPPKQGQRVRFQGSSVRPFIPDYYLGVAYLKLRNYAAADDAFGRARAAGIITSGDSEYEDFVGQSQEAKFERVIADAGAALTAGNVNAAARIADQLGPLRNAAPGGAARLTALLDNIGKARAAATAAPPAATNPAPPAGTTPPPPAPPPSSALPPPSNPSNPSPPAATPPSVPPATPPASAAPPPNTTPPAVAPRSPAAAPVASRTPARPPTTTPLEPPRRAGDETQAIVAFFSGEYREAAGQLRVLTSSPDASPRTRFYYACSLAALVFTGEIGTAEVTLAEARAELRRAGGLAAFDRDRRLVSPRILSALEARQ